MTTQIVVPNTSVDYPKLVIPLESPGVAGEGFFAETITKDHSVLGVSLRNQVLVDGEGSMLGNFEVFARMSATDEWFQVCNSGEGNDPWNLGIYPCIHANTDPSGLAFEQDAWFLLDVSAFYSVKFRVGSQYTGAPMEFAMSTMLKNGIGGTYTPTTVSAP